MAMAFPAHERRRLTVVRPSGARKGRSMALTGSCSRWMGGDGGQHNAARRLIGPAMFLILVACGGDAKPGDVAAPSSTTSPVATSSSSTIPPSTNPTTSTTVDPAAEIVARYKQFWQVRFQANQPPPNPDLASLAEYATGPQLDQVRAETRKNLQEKTAVRHAANPTSRSSVKVIERGADEARLQECVVDDDVIFRYSTGEVLNSGVATHSVEATMRRVDGVWKLASARLLQRWEGVAGCALSGGS